MTLEETARYFSRIWGKDVNRTHIARIKNHARAAAQEHFDDESLDGPYHQAAQPNQQLSLPPVVPPPAIIQSAPPVVSRGDLTIGTGVPPSTQTIPQQFIRSQAPLNMRPDRPQAPPPSPSLQHKHPLFNNFMIPPQFKFQKECYNNNHEEIIRNNQFQQANYDYQLHLQKQHQQQQANQLEDGDSGISVGSSISPTSNIEHSPQVVSRGSVIMSTKSALSRINTPAQPVKRETIEVSSIQSMAEKVFNCPQCDWQSYDKAKFWEHITSNHFKNMVLPKLATLPGEENTEKPTDAELDVIDIKTQPIESDDVIMMT